MAAGSVTRFRVAFVEGKALRPPTGDEAPKASDGIERAKFPSSGSWLPDEPHDFSGIREPLLPVFAEDQSVVDVDVEYAVRPFHQVRLDAECVTQLVCQADGLAGVVSWFAPDDLGPHRCLHVYLSDVPSAPATRNTPQRRSPRAARRGIGSGSPGVTSPEFADTQVERRSPWPGSFVS
jgi:hypothetical protein